MRIAFATVNAVLATVLFTFGQNPEMRQNAVDDCIVSLSGFPQDDGLKPVPPYPVELTGVSIEYFASGCYGRCPAFSIIVTKNVVRFQRHSHVRAKGNHQAQLTDQQFEAFLHAWYDGGFYKMRDNYCVVTCRDGTVVTISDIPKSSVKMTTPVFTKKVFDCFTTIDNRPETPKPPQRYFELSRQLKELARAHHWL